MDILQQLLAASKWRRTQDERYDRGFGPQIDKTNPENMSPFYGKFNLNPRSLDKLETYDEMARQYLLLKYLQHNRNLRYRDDGTLNTYGSLEDVITKKQPVPMRLYDAPETLDKLPSIDQPPAFNQSNKIKM